jgi:hypothetical protein
LLFISITNSPEKPEKEFPCKLISSRLEGIGGIRPNATLVQEIKKLHKLILKNEKHQNKTEF